MSTEIASPPVSLPPDTHTHTRLCRHATGEPADYARAALEAGLTEIACTDHIPFPDDPQPTIRMALEDFPLYLEMVHSAAAEVPGCRILLGLEADHRPDLVAARHLDRLLAQDDFDIVLGSVHSGPFWDLDPDDPAATPAFVEDMWRTYFHQLTDLANSRLYDAVAHIDLPKRRGLRPPLPVIRDMVLPALDAIAESNMAVEINTSGLTHGAKEPYCSPDILQWMAERDIPILFGSDAHRPRDIARYFPEALDLARTSGITHRAEYRKRKLTRIPL